MTEDKSSIDLTEWSRWFNKFVLPVFNSEGREKYYDKLEKIQAPFYPKYWIAEKFYESIKNDKRFDDELKLFFSFLYSCGFFMENMISFEDWLRMSNWWRPHLEEADEKPILKIIEEPNGLELLKFKIRWLPFLSPPEGY